MTDSSVQWCEHCGHFAQLDHHVCPPAWQVWQPDAGQARSDGITVYADSAAEAAEEWARQRDEGASPFSSKLRGGDCAVDICVAQLGSPAVQRLRVTGETVPRYYVAKLEQEAGGEE